MKATARPITLRLCPRSSPGSGSQVSAEPVERGRAAFVEAVEVDAVVVDAVDDPVANRDGRSRFQDLMDLAAVFPGVEQLLVAGVQHQRRNGQFSRLLD